MAIFFSLYTIEYIHSILYSDHGGHGQARGGGAAPSSHRQQWRATREGVRCEGHLKKNMATFFSLYTIEYIPIYSE
jgi:hypothetical protein